MSPILLIAHREVMAYVKTVGFWLSLLSLPFFAALGGFVPMLMKRAEPVHAYVMVDETPNAGLAGAVRASLEREQQRSATSALSVAAVGEAGITGRDRVAEAAREGGYEAGLAELKKVAPRAGAGFQPPRADIVELPVPADLAQAAPGEALDAVARQWVQGEQTVQDQTVSAVVILSEKDGLPSARIWSRRATNNDLESKVRKAIGDAHRHQAFAAAGVDAALIGQVETFRPDVTLLSPRAASGGEVSLRDRLPAVIGLMSGFLMWSLIITGATMLMNGVMEEKSNKILEILLSSVTATELLVGKVLGVAILTLTVMVGWGVISAVGLSMAWPDIARDIGAVLLHNGLWFYLLLFLVGGYLMYAVLFAAIGAFCETPRDAQTLMGPVMMALVVPLLFMQMALRSPDALVLKVMSLIPPFTPFIMAARAPSEPPLVEVMAGVVMMFAFAALMTWLSGRAFRAGALSDVKLSWKSFMGAISSRN